MSFDYHGLNTNCFVSHESKEMSHKPVCCCFVNHKNRSRNEGGRAELFQELIVRQKADQFVLDVYGVTAGGPKYELNFTG